MTDDTQAQATVEVPPPDPELGRLRPLLGTWKAQGHTEDSVLGPGAPVSSTERFYWLDGGYFLVSTYDTVFGAEPAQTGINYWGYDSEARKFRIIFFSNNGPFSEDGNRYEGAVADGKLIFEGPTSCPTTVAAARAQRRGRTFLTRLPGHAAGRGTVSCARPLRPRQHGRSRAR